MLITNIFLFAESELIQNFDPVYSEEFIDGVDAKFGGSNFFSVTGIDKYDCKNIYEIQILFLDYPVYFCCYCLLLGLKNLVTEAHISLRAKVDRQCNIV